MIGQEPGKSPQRVRGPSPLRKKQWLPYWPSAVLIYGVLFIVPMFVYYIII